MGGERAEEAVHLRVTREADSADEVEEAAWMPGPADLRTSTEGGGGRPEVVDNVFPDLDGYVVVHMSQDNCGCLYKGLTT